MQKYFLKTNKKLPIYTLFLFFKTQQELKKQMREDGLLKKGTKPPQTSKRLVRNFVKKKIKTIKNIRKLQSGTSKYLKKQAKNHKLIKYLFEKKKNMIRFVKFQKFYTKKLLSTDFFYNSWTGFVLYRKPVSLFSFYLEKKFSQHVLTALR